MVKPIINNKAESWHLLPYDFFIFTIFFYEKNKILKASRMQAMAT